MQLLLYPYDLDISIFYRQNILEKIFVKFVLQP